MTDERDALFDDADDLSDFEALDELDGRLEGLLADDPGADPPDPGDDDGPDAGAGAGTGGRRRTTREHRSRRRRRRTVVLLLVLVLVPFGVASGIAAWVWWQLAAPGGAGDEVEITIDSGWSTAQIADHLEDHGVIGNAFVFRTYAALRDRGPFQAGDYTLQERLGVRAAIDVLEAGPRLELVALRVNGGLWLEEVAARVDEIDGLDGDRFLEVVTNGVVRSRYQPEGVDTLEGLLFPDTYLVGPGQDEVDVAQLMVDRFEEVAARVGLAGADLDRLGGPDVELTPYDVVVAASLIETEARLDAERPLVASVVYNRLRDGMLLQIDATVLYAIGERRSSNTAEDREVDAPHNTYRFEGLPPTPIATVSEASLRAALDPADTDHRFYVLADEDGTHAFAPTFEEHQRNVERARELGLLG